MSGCLVVLLLLGVIVMCTLALVFHGASWTRSVTMAFAGGFALALAAVAVIPSVQGSGSIASRLSEMEIPEGVKFCLGFPRDEV